MVNLMSKGVKAQIHGWWQVACVFCFFLSPLNFSVVCELSVFNYQPTNKQFNKDKKQLAFAPASLILANNFLPVI